MTMTTIDRNYRARWHEDMSRIGRLLGIDPNTTPMDDAVDQIVQKITALTRAASLVPEDPGDEDDDPCTRPCCDDSAALDAAKAASVRWMVKAKEAEARAEKAEKERDKARAERDEATAELRAEQPRPLTATDIYDLVKGHETRLGDAIRGLSPEEAMSSMRIASAVYVALTPPPARDPQAEDLAELISGWNTDLDPDSRYDLALQIIGDGWTKGER